MPDPDAVLLLDAAADVAARVGDGRPGDGPAEAATVLLLEGSELNRRLLWHMLRNEGYRILEAGNPIDALAVISRDNVDLVILELMMPGMDGLQFCRRLKSSRRTRFLPLLILTSVPGTETEVAGIASGADEFLVKPLHPNVIRARVRSMLRHKSAIDSLEEAEAVLFALAQAIECRDSGTRGHCERLASLSTALGSALGLGRQQLLALHRGGYLHDIGKIGIPDAILFKPGKLTSDEWRIMQRHTVQGEEICRPAKTLAPVLPIIRHHHERWDGSGYPDGLAGEEIPLAARVLQVADIYDALTSERPYKQAFSPDQAMDILEQEASAGWRDPNVVGALRRIYDARKKAPSKQRHADPMVRSLEKLHRALTK